MSPGLTRSPRRAVLVAFVALAGCGGASSPSSKLAGAAGASSAGAAGIGPGGTGGGSSTGSAGGAGLGGDAGSGGGAAPAGAGGAVTDAGATGGEAGALVIADGSAGAAGAGGASVGGADGGTGVVDLTKVVSAGAGCGKDAPAALIPGTLVQQTIMTMGVKRATCADAMCGPWTDTREYYVRLPIGYDKNKPYPVVFEGPGCGGHGNNLYTIPTFDSTVIRIGLTPSAYWQKYHATNPSQGCFDDKDGDKSVDWVFYEDLYDLLASTACFDRNRVFFGGNSSGAWLANEAGCKYAGAAKYAVRGVMPNNGSLPTEPMYAPTCTDQAMAALWVRTNPDATDQFDTSVFAINRALKVAGCIPAGVTFSNAMFEGFPISAADATSCKRFTGCPDAAPLVVCTLAANPQTANQSTVVVAWPAFLGLFSKAPLLTP